MPFYCDTQVDKIRLAMQLYELDKYELAELSDVPVEFIEELLSKKSVQFNDFTHRILQTLRLRWDYLAEFGSRVPFRRQATAEVLKLRPGAKSTNRRRL